MPVVKLPFGLLWVSSFPPIPMGRRDRSAFSSATTDFAAEAAQSEPILINGFVRRPAIAGTRPFPGVARPTPVSVGGAGRGAGMRLRGRVCGRWGGKSEKDSGHKIENGGGNGRPNDAADSPSWNVDAGIHCPPCPRGVSGGVRLDRQSGASTVHHVFRKCGITTAFFGSRSALAIRTRFTICPHSAAANRRRLSYRRHKCSLAGNPDADPGRPVARFP